VIDNRRIDALVAERIFGFDIMEPIRGIRAVQTPEGARHTLRRYSTDIAAAWTVAEALIAKGWSFALDSEWGNPWKMVVWGAGVKPNSPSGTAVTKTLTPCLAICIAALHAAGVPDAEIQAALDGAS